MPYQLDELKTAAKWPADDAYMDEGALLEGYKTSHIYRRLMPHHSLVDVKSSHHPIISYRQILPSDLTTLEKIHSDLFPIRYESEFFQNVVNGRDIVSWGAVDRSRLNPETGEGELVGFVTMRIVLAKESELSDLLRCDSSMSDQTLVYILTLGVVDSYRNYGIASALIKEVVKYASKLANCRAVYLHVISYNAPAIHLYKKMSFQCLRRLYGFYLINGQYYDAYLFVYYVNGGRSPCSPLELAMAMVTYLRSGVKLVASRLWRNGERRLFRWPKCKETRCIVKPSQSKRNLVGDETDYQCV